MANMVLSEVLSEIGWDRKFAIPVSNTENKALEDEIQRKHKELAHVENQASQHKERINAMTEHLKNVQQELTHTQALCRAVEKQTDSEQHFKALDERETGRLRQEISQLQNELISLREKKNSQENYIFKATQKMEELKDQLNWDQQTLDAWLEESSRKDEDTMAIVKYAQQDESRIRELTLSMEKLTLEANRKRKALDNEVTETIMAQVALEKTVEMVQQAHAERQELISQWENSIEQMRKKDQDLQQCALLLAETNQVIRERKALIKEKQNFLANEVENNKECEKKIAAVERQANRLRQQFQEEESNRTRLQDELVSLKGRLDRTATDLEAKRSHLASIKKDINDKTAKLEDIQHYNVALEEKLQAVTEEALSVEERAAQMEQLHRDQEKHLKEIDTQLQREQKLLFQKKQELQTLRAKEKNVVADISGSRVALSSLDIRLSKLDQNALKQQEYINSQDFQIQLLEGKMARLSGNVNKEEKQALEKQVSELSEVLEEKKKAAAMLAAQLKKLQNDIRCVRKENEKTGAEERNLTTKIEELNLVDDTLDKDLKKLRLKKQDSIVENNILQLEVKRLRTMLYDKADGVLSLEKRKLQLQTAMKERQEEIRVHREMHSKQLKITEQEMQGLRAQLHERLSRVDKMKKKYEIITISMAAPEGEEDKSQAYYIIKAAQEKEELQRKGDDLDSKIRKAEKENKALENTMHLLNNHNSTYRKSFNKVTESSPEYQEKLKLEEQKRAADEKVKFKRRQIRELQENIEAMSSSLNSLQQEEVAQTKRNVDLHARIVSLNKELVSQQEKLDRATKQSSKLKKEIRSTKNTTEETFEERDIKLKELKDCKKAINKMLLDVMEQYPDLQAILQTYYMQANLPLPSPASTPSSRSSKLSSACSSFSLRSSRSSGPSADSSARGSAVHSPSVKMVELGLGLRTQSPGSDSSRSSRSSHLKTP
ncbi:coiled-coil domain-containing protein 39 [Pangasianodon hypophthalmus]|uniref:coiled-coil domain-containing protein 39 n=1 Tax=Pangasianodon hypophthalmus TaxID=310915 RepID=UPI002308090D|nr:coiled-coil domain-containing protein 39 [Pangasianodon hypophthalmus]XP_053089256.1 coiled-coil domain-containing protein 39 [Pangasianodon hypophthalmus]XP_053089257.1 coiled-coil domain-containing protein 39 [Pangasianodon hypophthalmus]XP_053089259.1 coiled-coil domain-containing protein 39 [Pangasianodon hypophthalmus]